MFKIKEHQKGSLSLTSLYNIILDKNTSYMLSLTRAMSRQHKKNQEIGGKTVFKGQVGNFLKTTSLDCNTGSAYLNIIG